jgi:Ca-activated chloride channel family protein
MFNPKSFDNSRPDGIGVLEIVDQNKPKSEQLRLFVPLKRTELSGEITGPLAALRLTQTYGFSSAACEKTLEAVYRFPLPGDAAVTKVRVCFGEVEINAELKERGQAEDEYQEARREGRQAALATRESPDVFTLHVAGIQPDQDVRVETSYLQLTRAEGAGWSLRIPLTTSPRYVRSDEFSSRHAQGQPLALLRDPGHRFALDLTLRGVGALGSNTHSINAAQDGDDIRVTLRDGEVIPDRDCVLMWRPQQAKQRPAIQAWAHNDPDSGQIYFLAMVTPPSAPASANRAAREAILLVDHSGSMEGAKWAAADWAVKSFLYGMSQRDQFALGLFHTTTRWFDRKPRQADGRIIEEAIRFLEKNRDSGGTELGVALEQALALERTKDERARHVLVITDAEVTDEGRILRLATEESKAADRRRISVLCIDAAPNSHLAMELAERGGGLAKFLTSDPAEEDIATALDEVLADWAEPLQPNLRLEVNRAVAQAAGHEVKSASEAGWSAIDLGDLPAGRAVWVVGRVPRGKQTDLSFRVRASDGLVIADNRIELPEFVNEMAIKSLFGARRVLGLEYLIQSGYSGQELREQLERLGYDPDQALASPAAGKPKVYAENVREDASRALRNLLVREALDYGLASSETAFVATRTEAGKVVEESVVVANALPAGWSDRFNTGALQMLASPAQPAGPRMDAMLIESAEMDYLEDAGTTVGFAPQAMASQSWPPPLQYPTAGGFAAEPDALRGDNHMLLFSGIPSFTGGQALLFDSGRDRGTHRLPDRGTITRVVLRFPDGTPTPESLDAGLSLLIFVDDLSMPRAKVRLPDIVRQGGSRPLNLAWQSRQELRIVLADPAGVWSRSARRIEVSLDWI